MNQLRLTAALLFLMAVAGCGRSHVASDATPPAHPIMSTDAMTETNPIAKIVRADAEWKALLSPEQYQVLRQAGTEPAFCGAFWNNHEPGIYHCAACDLDLFVSDTKFDSGTGWPSFFNPVASNRLLLKTDNSYGMRRTEVLCARCDSHLGHVFDDGPPPTHQRFCMNSVSLKFVPKSAKR